MSHISTTSYRASGDAIVFGGVDKSVEELKKIVRILKLEKSLPVDPGKKAAKVEQLAKVWQVAQESLNTSVAGAKEAIKSGLNSLKERGMPPIAPIYNPELNSTDATEIGAKIQQFLHDSKCVSITPIQKSAGGKKGPTFLARYSAPEGGRAYVIKRSDLTEEVSNHVYEAYGSGFSVPACAGFDLVKNRHGSAHMEVSQVSASVSKDIKTTLSKLIETDDPMIDKVPEFTHLMLSERVVGQDLMIFAYTNYLHLTPEQKTQLFKQMGKLAFLDLVLGNMDRLIQVSDEHELTDKLEANLGNVMVSYQNTGVYVYAIDNGIEQKLIDNQAYRNGYLEFLKSHFVKENPFGLLADNIIQNLHNALQSQTDDIRNNEGKNQSDNKIDLNSEAFYNDLQNIGHESLYEGLVSMAKRLKKKISGEESSEILELKQYLQQVYPEYLTSIQERFDAFAKISIRGMK